MIVLIAMTVSAANDWVPFYGKQIVEREKACAGTRERFAGPRCLS